MGALNYLHPDYLRDLSPLDLISRVDDPRVELLPLPGVPIRDFAHTVCLTYLLNSTPTGTLIFNHAMEVALNLYIPKGTRFIPFTQGLDIGGFDSKTQKIRGGPVHSVLKWLRENQATESNLLRSDVYPDDSTLVIANLSMFLGSIRVHPLCRPERPVTSLAVSPVF